MSKTIDELLEGLALDLLPTPEAEKRVYEAVVGDRWKNPFTALWETQEIFRQAFAGMPVSVCGAAG